jgi:hypothetical protein
MRGLDWQLNLLNNSKLQATIALSLIRTLCSSLQHALSLLSLLYLRRLSPGNGLQRLKFLSVRVYAVTDRRDCLTSNYPESESYITTDGQPASVLE